MNEQRIAAIRDRLSSGLTVEDLSIRDDSHLHVGHAGARDGRGHFAVRIVSPDFVGLSRIERHKKVFAAVGSLMQTDIHALVIEAVAPDENAASNYGGVE